jgi:hypothetical protein
LDAIAAWHDPAGMSILVSCFGAIWLLGYLLRSPARPGPFPVHEVVFPEKAVIPPNIRQQAVTSSPVGLKVLGRSAIPLVFSIWLGFVEVGTEMWYRVHEQHLAAPIGWQVELPREQPEFCELPLSPNLRQLLRFDQGLNAGWSDGTGLRWQAIFLRWDPGRIAVYLANNHTPEDCLTAAGRELVSQSGLYFVSVHGLELPFRAYVARDERGPFHIFYCLWDDRAPAGRAFDAKWLSYWNRLRPVLAGRRNSGQRSLELALWGAADDESANSALREVLSGIIKVED